MRHSDAGRTQTIKSVRREFERIQQLLSDPLIAKTDVVDGIKNLALAYEAFTKYRTKHLKGMIRSSFVKLRLIMKVLSETRQLILIQKLTLEERSKESVSSRNEVRLAFDYLCEYLCFVVTHYLSTIEEAIERAFTADLKDRLKLRIKDLVLQELALSKALNLQVTMTNAEDVEEQFYKVRLLKKYFQKALFVNVEAEPFSKKIIQPIAGLAAGVAAVWAAFFHMAQTHHGLVSRMGLTNVGIIGIGVLAYVVKDRIKDVLKARLAGKVEKVLPDIERRLFYQIPDSKPRPLGSIKEYIRRLSVDRLPEDIRDARYSGGVSGLERELGEDIIHYGKRIRLNHKLHVNEKEHLGLREILRLNLSPYLSKLDDPFKELSFVSESGRISKNEVHRLYYAHLAVKISAPDSQGANSQLYVSRLAVDRKGIVRIATH